MSDISYNASNNIARGKDALVAFHNEALKYTDNYNISFDQLLSTLSAQSNGQFLSGFGDAIVMGDISDSDVKDSMTELADKGEGHLPMSWNSFFQALHKNYGFSFDALAFTAKQSVSDIGTGLVATGNVVKDTLKNASGLVTWLPLMAFVGLGAYIYFRAKA